MSSPPLRSLVPLLITLAVGLLALFALAYGLLTMNILLGFLAATVLIFGWFALVFLTLLHRLVIAVEALDG